VVDPSETDAITDTDILLRRDCTPHRVSLEDYVAYQWEGAGDLLGQKHAQKRDAVALEWLADAVNGTGGKASVLDVGCSYGNHLFMLDALLRKRETVEMVGVDLYTTAVRRANAFARAVPGYSNCRFEVADVSVGLPFPDATFTAINFCDVLEHLLDPGAALKELQRLAVPGGTIVVSTPLRDTLPKRAAAFGNRVLGGKLYRAYYRGKGAELDEHGDAVMEPTAGHAHVSELTLSELRQLSSDVGLRIERVELMSVMSGSRWFDDHAVLLAGLVLLEAVHEKLRRPSWAHSAMVRLRKPERHERAGATTA